MRPQAGQRCADALLDFSVERLNVTNLVFANRRGKICSGGWVGGAANLEAFTDTRWVSVRGDIAPYPF